MKNKLNLMAMRSHAYAQKLVDNQGSGYVEMLIKILISVVVGALILTLIVALINTLWPDLTQRIIDLFSTDVSSTTST